MAAAAIQSHLTHSINQDQLQLLLRQYRLSLKSVQMQWYKFRDSETRLFDIVFNSLQIFTFLYLLCCEIEVPYHTIIDNDFSIKSYLLYILALVTKNKGVVLISLLTRYANC